ncbi:unnamed protein product, partial [Mycena citricolor]
MSRRTSGDMEAAASSTIEYSTYGYWHSPGGYAQFDQSPPSR